MMTLYIILIILVGIVALFILVNRIYRRRTKDQGIEKRIINGAIVLDVRTKKEFNKGHIEGSLNISLGTIRERYIELDSSKTYITYCSHGIRSVEVKSILKDRGFKQVYNGGTMSDLSKIIQKANRINDSGI